MLKCQTFPSSNLFLQNAAAAEGGHEGGLGGAVPPSPASGGAADMGADRRLSDLVGNDFVESATSIFKVFFGGGGAVTGDNSTNSNVAIDNKIEQAMDLVKSHLMFAVREEVEILKEQIKELMLKNQQLEYENAILRADATPETLAKLQSAVPL
jgi:hypothetical protein